MSPRTNFFQKILFVSFAFLMIIACSKTEIKEAEPVPPAPETADYNASFTVYTLNVDSGAAIIPGTGAAIDSTFFFVNKSDSSSGATYSWNFGDGSSSTDRHPIHKYSKRGKYNVLLTVSKNNLTDTSKQVVSVWLGVKELKDPIENYLEGESLVQSASGDLTLLASYKTGEEYYIYTLDSLLNLKKKTTLPQSIRLAFVQPTTDGNYIGSGLATAGNSQFNEIVKLTSSGSAIWSRQLTMADNIRSAYELSDGSYVGIGTQLFRPPNTTGSAASSTTLTKVDGAGNIQWQTVLYDQRLANSKDAVLESDGIVVAGSFRGSCPDCDSISIAKVGFNGAVIWNKTVSAGGSRISGPYVNIIKLVNGNYAVASSGNNSVFLFSGAGAFIAKHLAEFPIAALSASTDGNIMLLQTRSTPKPMSLVVSKMKSDGSIAWTKFQNSSVKNTRGENTCCSMIYGYGNIITRKDGGTVSLGIKSTGPANDVEWGVMTTLLPLMDDGSLY